MFREDLLKKDIKVRLNSDGDAGIVMAGGDVDTVNGLNTLEQAIIMRLLTPLGELTALGHPKYGSRLHELIGHPLHTANLQLIERFVKISLKHEKRILKTENIKAYTLATTPGVAHVDLLATATTGESISLGVSVHV